MAKKKQASPWFAENFPSELLDSPAFRFEITLPNMNKIVVDTTANTEVDYDTIEEDMETIPAQYAFYSTLSSEVRHMAAILERRVKARKGFLTEAAMKMAKTEGLRLTEGQIKTVIESDETLNDLERQFAATQRDSGKLYHTVEMLKMRLDVMRSLAGFKRQDRDNQR